MDYPTNGPGPDGASAGSASGMDINERTEGVREYAQDVVENLNEAVKRGREMVLRYPALSVAGAVAAGYLFAKLVARRVR